MADKPIIYRYPLDLTGVSPGNLVTGEVQTLPTGSNRAIVPNYGAFYAESLVVKDLVTGDVLVPREQYKAIQPYAEASDVSGLEVSAILVIVDPTVSQDVEISYQAIGGEFCYSVLALRRLITTVDWESLIIQWGDTIGVPESFPPAPHLHDSGDLYTFHYLVEALEAIYFAIVVGDETDHDKFRDRLTSLDDDLEVIWKEIDQAFQEHLDDLENPHQLTQGQIKLGLVENHPVASIEEAKAAERKDRYLTPFLADLHVMDVHSQSDAHDWRYWTRDEADERFVLKIENVNITLEGPKTVVQGTPVTIWISNYSTFSRYTADIEYGNITLDEDTVTVEIPEGVEVKPTVELTFTCDDVVRKITLNVETASAGVSHV